MTETKKPSEGAPDGAGTASAFKSESAFSAFQIEVARHSRFAHTEASREFLDSVRRSAQSRLITVRKGHPLWRVQVGSTFRMHVQTNDDGTQECEYEVPAPYGPERMVPDPAKVGDGRLNPRGIACFYLAESEATAIAEARPWLGADISVGVFEVLQDSVLVNCTKSEYHPFRGTIHTDRYEPPPEGEWDDLVWGDIGHAFAVPVAPDASHAYAPTQILAEVLRNAGYDGILYRSAMHRNGSNVALFDINRARLFSCAIHRVSKITYVSHEIEQGYARQRVTVNPPKSTGGE